MLLCMLLCGCLSCAPYEEAYVPCQNNYYFPMDEDDQIQFYQYIEFNVWQVMSEGERVEWLQDNFNYILDLNAKRDDIGQ